MQGTQVQAIGSQCKGVRGALALVVLLVGCGGEAFTSSSRNDSDAGVSSSSFDAGTGEAGAAGAFVAGAAGAAGAIGGQGGSSGGVSSVGGAGGAGAPSGGASGAQQAAGAAGGGAGGAGAAGEAGNSADAGSVEEDGGASQCALDCDDNNPCTGDVCNSGTCEHFNNAEFCASDNDPCTDDICAGGQCVHPANTDCPP